MISQLSWVKPFWNTITTCILWSKSASLVLFLARAFFFAFNLGVNHIKRPIETITDKSPYWDTRDPVPDKLADFFTTFLFKWFHILFGNVEASKSPTTSTPKSTMSNSKLTRRIDLSGITTPTSTRTASLSASAIFNKHTVHIPSRMGPPEFERS